MDIITRQYAPYLQCTYATLEASTHITTICFSLVGNAGGLAEKWAHHRSVEWNIMPPHCFYDWSWHESLPFLFAFRPTVSLCIKFWFDLSIPTSMFFSLAFVFPWLKSICKVFCITSGNSSQSSVPQASSYNFRVGLQGNGKVDLHLRSCNKLPLNAIFAISNAFLWL